MQRLLLTPAHRAAILAHARACAPQECCGVLIGRPDRAGVRVETVLPAENVAAGDRRRRYDIDPRALLDAHRRARAEGRQVVGYFHSHPDRPAAPSATDRAHALPRASYLIVALGDRGEVRSWRLRDGGDGFDEERVEVAAAHGAGAAA